ncbi:MAG: Tol-Pal system protein TolB [Bacteriovorax sp.]|nr:Tol-Pal system protein TolB [Rhizobacter sp.]
MLIRRQFCSAAGLALLIPTLPALAEFRVEISGVGATQLPIAVVKFRDEERSTPSLSLSAIVRADLERSGVFRSIDMPASAATLDENSQPAMPEWRGRAADALVAGSITRLADGRFDVRFKLWDVVKGVVLGGQSTAVDAADLRLAAHRIADFIYEKLTGDKGVFSTRIAYVTKGSNRFTLRVADADGEGGQVALNSPEPIISPAWSPDGKQLAYVSFETQKAVVYTQDASTGVRRAVANFKGSNSAPAWSPDGQTLAVTLSRENGSQLYLIARDGSNVRRLTQSNAIDTEPVFAPDGRGIYFVSDRGGGPQIYRTSLTGGTGGNVERVTFGGSYNTSPAISPDGRMLAYISRQGGAFRLYTLDLTGNAQPVALTDTGDDEHPSFAPNGRLIIYASRLQGRDVLMTTTLDGKIKARLVSTTADVRAPAWGPYGR